MPKRSSEILTLRERQCQQVARDKARRKTLGAWKRRTLVAGGCCAFVAAVCLSVWEWRAQGVSRAYGDAMQGFYAATARAGFTVKAVGIEGRRRTEKAEVDRLLSGVKGKPILSVQLDDLRTALERLPTVKHASVERSFSGLVTVRLTEREPVAVWQHGGKLSLIDDEGSRMDDLALADYRSLPLVVGEGAARHVKEAQAVLAAQPQLAPQVAALTRVGDRRWNVRFASGLEVKLPERGALDAWERFARMAQKPGFSLSAVAGVDLRLEQRMFIRFRAPAAASTASASET